MVGGRYVIGGLLGRGASGTVHAAQHAFTGAQVALKIIAPARGPADDDTRARFMREARVAGSLDHPGVVRIFDAGIDDGGSAFIAMERLHGVTLDRWCRDHQPSPREFVKLLARVADALAHAHENGLVHRDVKPGNVFVVPRADGGFCAKLLDFGLCRGGGDDRVTRTGFLVGTPYYMSPERALEGDDALTPAADVWSLGAMLYEGLSGRRPFEGDGPAQVLRATIQSEPAPLEGVHPTLVDIVGRCLRKDAARRPADGAALRALLQRCVIELDAAVDEVEPPAAEHPGAAVPDAMRLYCAPTDARMLLGPPPSRLMRWLLVALAACLVSMAPPLEPEPVIGQVALAPTFEWMGPPAPEPKASEPATKVRKRRRKPPKKTRRRR